MKKFISMFAFAAAIVFGAFTLASCGDDDDAKSTILTGTVWKGVISYGPLKAETTIKFHTTTYEISIVALDGSLLMNTTKGNYSMSSDNKTVYITAETGQTIGKISDDGKTMTINNSASEAAGTLTKQ